MLSFVLVWSTTLLSDYLVPGIFHSAIFRLRQLYLSLRKYMIRASIMIVIGKRILNLEISCSLLDATFSCPFAPSRVGLARKKKRMPPTGVVRSVEACTVEM